MMMMLMLTIKMIKSMAMMMMKMIVFLRMPLHQTPVAPFLDFVFHLPQKIFFQPQIPFVEHKLSNFDKYMYTCTCKYYQINLTSLINTCEDFDKYTSPSSWTLSSTAHKNNLFTSNSICRTRTFQMFIVHDLDDEITRIQTRRNKANETRNGFENESEIGLFSSF